MALATAAVAPVTPVASAALTADALAFPAAGAAFDSLVDAGAGEP